MRNREFLEMNILVNIVNSKMSLTKAVASGIEESCFKEKPNRKIYRVTGRLYKEGKVPNRDLLEIELQDENIDKDYISALFNMNPDKLNFDKYIKELVLETLQEDIKNNTQQFIDEYKNGNIDELQLKEKIDELHQTLKEKQNEFYERELKGPEVISEYRKLKNQNSDLKLVNHLKFLSDTLCGLRYGELMFVAGETGMGKTNFALDIALNLSIEQPKKVLYLDTEVGTKTMIDRCCSMISGVPLTLIKSIKDIDATGLPKEYDNMFKNSLKLISNGNFRYKPVLGMTFDKIRKIIEKSITEDVKVIVFDYLGATKKERNNNGAEWQELADTAFQLKKMAMEYGVLIICPIQLNRTAVRNDVSLDAIAGSFAMSFWSDYVISIKMLRTKKELDSDDNSDTNGRLTILKHRNGDGIGKVINFRRHPFCLRHNIIEVKKENKKYALELTNEEMKMAELIKQLGDSNE